MKTEISRDSHKPKKRYSGVYQQQGRMLTDADWNELVEILKDRLNDALKDIVGSNKGGIGGTPRYRALKIEAVSDSGQLKIKPGHVYVDGVAAEINGSDTIIYNDQPDFQEPPPITQDNYVIYADVWERTVTYLMDDQLRDKGLHGADTCTRKQMMAQIKWCPSAVVDDESITNPSKGDAQLTLRLSSAAIHADSCDPCVAQVKVDSKVGNYLFRVEVHEVKGTASNPTEITLKWSSENGAEQYKALPNIEEMPAGFITNEWTYEFFDEISEKHLGVHFAVDSEGKAWEPARGTLKTFSGTDINEAEQTYEVPTRPGSKPKAPYSFVRRWDGFCVLTKTLDGWVIAKEDDDVTVRGMDRGEPLQDDYSTASGYVCIETTPTSSMFKATLANTELQLTLAKSDGKACSFVAGDFWLAEVRENGNEANSTLIENKAPEGIEHHYLALGTVGPNGLQANPEADRKYAFPPLTEMTRMFIAGGDGQEVMPGQSLPHPLRVAVANGEWPVNGAAIRFQIEDGGGTLSINGDTSGTKIVVNTSVNGIAECVWTPDSSINADNRVKAMLVDPDNPGNDLDHPPLYFYANLIAADQVTYDLACPSSTASTVHNLLAADTPSPPDTDPYPLILGDDNYYTVKEVLDALLCKLKANHLPYNDPVCNSDSVSVRSLLSEIGLDFDNNGHITVSDILDTLLCKLNAKRIPYDPFVNEERWKDIQEKTNLIEKWQVPYSSQQARNFITNSVAVDSNKNTWMTLSWRYEEGSVNTYTTHVTRLGASGEILKELSFDAVVTDISIATDDVLWVVGYNSVTGRYIDKLFLAKVEVDTHGDYDCDILSSKFEMTKASQGLGLAVDNNNHVIVAGKFLGKLNFNNEEQALENKSDTYDMFLAKFSRNGKLSWTKQLSGEGDVTGGRLDTNDSNQIIISGSFKQSVKIGEQEYTNYETDVPSIYLAKFGADKGDVLWSTSFCNAHHQYAIGLKADGDNNILCTGLYYEEINFSAVGGPKEGYKVENGKKIFLIKLIAEKGDAYKLLWSKSLGGEDENMVFGLAVDSKDNVCVSGHFQTSIDFGEGDIHATGDFPLDAFFASFYPNGGYRCSKVINADQRSRGLGVAASGQATVIHVTAHYPDSPSADNPDNYFLRNYVLESLPITVQRAIDELIENLESSDIRYTFKDDCVDTPYGVKSLNSYVREDLDKIASNSTTKIENLWDSLLCLLDAKRIPYDPTLKEARWRDIKEIGHLGVSWSVEEETPGRPVASQLVKDGDGNVIAAASSMVTADSRSGGLTQKFFSVLVKLDDNTGQIVWKKEFNALVGGLGVQSDGTIVIAGSFLDDLELGGTAPSMSSTGKSNIYVAGLRADGEALWNAQFGTTETEILTGLAIDSADSIYLTGHFQETINFGGPDLVPGADQDIFIAKLNADGDHDWSDNYATSGDVKYAQLQVDQKDNIFLTGSFSGELNFGGGTLTSTSPSTESIFLAKLDGNGTHQWSYKFGGNNDSGGSAVAIDDEENLLLCGYMGYSKPPFSNKTAFIAKFTDNGSDITGQWSKGFASTESNAIAIATDADNNIVFGGNFSGAINFGGGEINAAEGADAFIARLDSNGNYLWANRFSVGQNVEVSRSIVLDNDGYPTFAWQLAKSSAFPNDSTLNHITKLNWEMRAAPATVQEALDDLVENLESSDINYRLPVCAGTKDSVRRRLFSLSGLADNTALKINNLFNALLCELDASSIPFDRNTDTGSLIDVFLNKEGAQIITGPLTIDDDDGASTPSTEILLDVKGTVKADAFVGISAGKWLDASGGDIYYKSGQVGIGTHDPSFILEVVTEPPSNNINPVAIFRTTGTSSSAGAIRFQNTKNNYFNIGITNDHDFAISELNKNISMRDDYLRITSGGKVGIGTTSPSYDLHTNGTSYAGKRAGGGIDYAEYFESLNRKKIPVGTSIVFEKGKVRNAKNGETPIGIISANPIIAGGIHTEWPKKYLRDEFGCLIMEEYKEEIMAPKKEKVKKEHQKVEKKKIEEQVTRTKIVYEKKKYRQKEITETVIREEQTPVFKEVDLYDAEGKNKIGTHRIPVMETYEEEIAVLDDEGNPVLVGTGKFETKERPKLNPDYDESKEYVPREKRPEWNCVGLLGQLYLRKGQPVAPTWVKIKDISDEVELWLVK